MYWNVNAPDGSSFCCLFQDSIIRKYQLPTRELHVKVLSNFTTTEELSAPDKPLEILGHYLNNAWFDNRVTLRYITPRYQLVTILVPSSVWFVCSFTTISLGVGKGGCAVLIDLWSDER